MKTMIVIGMVLMVAGCAGNPPVWQQEISSRAISPMYFDDFYQEPDRSKPFDWGISETRYR